MHGLAASAWRNSKAMLAVIGPIDRARVCDLRNFETDKPLSPGERVSGMKWISAYPMFYSFTRGMYEVKAMSLGNATWVQWYSPDLGCVG